MSHPDRHARQRILPWLGSEGQERIARSRVGVVGIGALGCTSSNLLARAGVGEIVLVDRDWVELGNLQRQILYGEDDARQRLPKVEAAAAELLRADSSIVVEKVDADLGPDEARDLFRRTDLVLDGTDNFETRFLINDAAVESGKPWIYAGAVGTTGALMVVIPGRTACLRCAFPDLPSPGSAPTCDTAGILGPLATAVASLQAAEAIKICAGREDLLLPGYAQVDLLDGTFRRTRFPLDPSCPCCGQRNFGFLEEKEGSRTHRVCGRDGVLVLAPKGTRVDLAAMESRLSALGPVFRNPYLLQMEWEGHPVTLYADGRAMIQRLEDPARARALYARYLGM
jgi:molybdopterin-synthase adenylyltransferase